MLLARNNTAKFSVHSDHFFTKNMKNHKIGQNFNRRRISFCTVYFLLVFIFLLLFNADAAAQEDKYSFRLRGMGQGLLGIVDDLYSDLSLNPAFIHRYKGNRLYTNLSNLQGGRDAQIFDQQLTTIRNTDIYPNNLIGTVFERAGTPFGIFLETRGYNIKVEDIDDDEQFLTLTNGMLSRRRQILDTNNALKSISFIGLVRDFGVALSIHRNDFTLQLEDENISSTFTVNDTTGMRENTAYLKNAAQQTFEFPNSMIAFSIGRISKKDNKEISWAIGRRPERMAFNSNEILSLFKEPFLNEIAERFDILENQDTGFIEMGLRSLYFNARLKKIYPSLTDLQQISYLFNFSRYSLPFNIKTVESTLHDSLDVAGAMRKRLTLTSEGISRAEGDGTINRIEMGAGIERHFNDLNTMIAFGAKLDHIWGDMDISFEPARIQRNLNIKVEIGDPAEEADSYNRVISDNKEGFIKSKMNGTFLSFPVGLETKLSEKFTLRFGARSVFSLKFKTEWESSKTDMPDELLQTSEDQTTFVPEDPLAHETVSVKKIDGRSLNYNSYHFGASYRINDALTIDLLHFSKLTELDTWWLSIVLKY